VGGPPRQAVPGHAHGRQRAVERKGTAIRLTETVGGITSVR
jgi:hypothetical protein